MESFNNSIEFNNQNVTFDTTNPFYQLLEKQATEFELFGQRLKSEIRNSYQELMNFQQQQQQKQQQQQHHHQQKEEQQKSQPTDNEITKPLEVIEDNSKESISFTNESLVDSLKARVEELETDSLIKKQDIEFQKSEIQQLKKELNNDEMDKMKKEIEELNDFKTNFILLFESFEQMKSEIKELKFKLVQKDIENDRLLAEQLQINENNTRLFSEKLQINDINDNNNNTKVRPVTPVRPATPKKLMSQIDSTDFIINGGFSSDEEELQSPFSVNNQTGSRQMRERTISSMSSQSTYSNMPLPRVPAKSSPLSRNVSDATHKPFTQNNATSYDDSFSPTNSYPSYTPINFDRYNANKVKRANTFTQNTQNNRGFFQKPNRI